MYLYSSLSHIYSNSVCACVRARARVVIEPYLFPFFCKWPMAYNLQCCRKKLMFIHTWLYSSTCKTWTCTTKKWNLTVALLIKTVIAHFKENISKYKEINQKRNWFKKRISNEVSYPLSSWKMKHYIIGNEQPYVFFPPDDLHKHTEWKYP